MNPLAQAAPVIAVVVLLIVVRMVWISTQRALRNHADPATIIKRQLKDAQRGRLLHQLEAEHHQAAADGHAATIARLAALEVDERIRIADRVHVREVSTFFGTDKAAPS